MFESAPARNWCGGKWLRIMNSNISMLVQPKKRTSATNCNKAHRTTAILVAFSCTASHEPLWRGRQWGCVEYRGCNTCVARRLPLILHLLIQQPEQQFLGVKPLPLAHRLLRH